MNRREHLRLDFVSIFVNRHPRKALASFTPRDRPVVFPRRDFKDAVSVTFHLEHAKNFFDGFTAAKAAFGRGVEAVNDRTLNGKICLCVDNLGAQSRLLIAACAVSAGGECGEQNSDRDAEDGRGFSLHVSDSRIRAAGQT